MVEYLLPALVREDGAQGPAMSGNSAAPHPSSASMAPGGTWKICYSPVVPLPGTSVKYLISVGKHILNASLSRVLFSKLRIKS